MISRAAIVLGAAGLLCASSIRGAATGTDSSRVLWQGPVFASAAVVWSEEGGGTGSLRQWTRQRGERVVYSSDSLALTRPLAASRTLLAFERTYPGCAPQPNVVCPQVEDALVGPLRGPFKTLVRPHKCSMPTLGNTVALDAGIAAYIDLGCNAQTLRILVRDVGHAGKPLVVRDAAISEGCCRDVAIAGDFVAWSEKSEVVVYDRRARRVAYRARIGPAAGVDLGFDLQPDGKLAVAYRPIELARGGPTTIAWVSPSAPRAHVLALRGTTTRIRIAGDRFAFERFLSPKTSAIVIANLAGRVQTVARFAPSVQLRSGFDFDGQNIAWASNRITATRLDCPPPGQGRPCVRRGSGITSLWLRATAGGAKRLIARLPFVDTIART
jgi:hypothetical protein